MDSWRLSQRRCLSDWSCSDPIADMDRAEAAHSPIKSSRLKSRAETASDPLQTSVAMEIESSLEVFEALPQHYLWFIPSSLG